MRNNAWFFAFLLALATVALAAWAGYEAGASSGGGSVARRGVWSPGPVTHSLAPPMQVPMLSPSPLPVVAGPPTLIDPNVSLLPAADELWSELPEGESLGSASEIASANVPVAYWQDHAAQQSDEQHACPAEGDAAATDDQPSESAATILEMRKRMGSVLEDTVFAPESEADAEAERRAILQHLQEFEEQDDAPADATPVNASPEGTYADPPAAPPHELTHRASCPHSGDQDAAARVVGSLREVSAQIDQLANELERANLFGQADNLRGMAQQLREDARAATRGQCPCQHVREGSPEQETITELPEIGEHVPSY